MLTILKNAMIAAAIIGVATVSANAAVGVGVDIGGISLGFSDGYWDNSHHWHRWAHPEDAQRFRAAHAASYHEWRHDDRNHH